MKKIILLVLMAVMLATPCFAQEVETEGIFSLHGTEWHMLPIGLQILPFPWIFYAPNYGFSFGFHNGTVYPLRLGDYYYIDLLVFSIFGPRITLTTHIGTHIGGPGQGFSYFGILQPIGIGILVEFGQLVRPPFYPFMTRMFLLIKTDDNWTPVDLE